MTGIVAPSLEILLPVGLRRLDGTEFEIECVLDTGFDGELGLPATVLAELGARPLYAPDLIYAQDFLLADGSLISVAVSGVDVTWNEG